MTVADCGLEPKPGGRAVLDYRDAEGRRYRSEGRVHAAEAPEHLAFDLAVLDAAGAVSFIGHYDLVLAAVPDGTRLRLGLTHHRDDRRGRPLHRRASTTGWSQVLDNLATALTNGKERSS